jgi:hypothetical protein
VHAKSEPSLSKIAHSGRAVIVWFAASRHDLPGASGNKSWRTLLSRWECFVKCRVMRNERDVLNATLYHRAIRKRIGEELSARHDLSQPLPDKLRILLAQFHEATLAPLSNASLTEPKIITP